MKATHTVSVSAEEIKRILDIPEDAKIHVCNPDEDYHDISNPRSIEFVWEDNGTLQT